MNIDQIMSRQLVTVELDDSLAQVKEIFDNVKFHHLLVTDEGKLIGVLSDRDLFKAISPNVGTSRCTWHDQSTLNKRVHQIVTRRPVTLPPQADVADAVTIFNSHPISCIPVVDEANAPVGIVSWRDILRNCL